MRENRTSFSEALKASLLLVPRSHLAFEQASFPSSFPHCLFGTVSHFLTLLFCHFQSHLFGLHRVLMSLAIEEETGLAGGSGERE